jgi:hypothetical protein
MRRKYKQNVRHYNHIKIPDYSILILNETKFSVNKKYIKLKPIAITIIYSTVNVTGFDLIF